MAPHRHRFPQFVAAIFITRNIKESSGTLLKVWSFYAHVISLCVKCVRQSSQPDLALPYSWYNRYVRHLMLRGLQAQPFEDNKNMASPNENVSMALFCDFENVGTRRARCKVTSSSTSSRYLRGSCL